MLCWPLLLLHQLVSLIVVFPDNVFSTSGANIVDMQSGVYCNQIGFINRVSCMHQSWMNEVSRQHEQNNYERQRVSGAISHQIIVGELRIIPLGNYDLFPLIVDSKVAIVQSVC